MNIKSLYRLIVILGSSLLLISITHAGADEIKSKLAKLLPPQMTIESINKSPMKGVYEVSAGDRTLYVYSKGDYVLLGDVYDVERQVSLGEEAAAKKMSQAIDAIPEAEMIVIGDPALKRYVTVFTDITCPFCQRFHLTVPTLNAAGLKVRYLMFPRAGLESQSYKDAVSVWCADDQAKAMTDAKAGLPVAAKTCPNPVAQHYLLGQTIGVKGTPTIVLDNGDVMPGFVPAERLLAQAGLK